MKKIKYDAHQRQRHTHTHTHSATVNHNNNNPHVACACVCAAFYSAVLGSFSFHLRPVSFTILHHFTISSSSASDMRISSTLRLLLRLRLRPLPELVLSQVTVIGSTLSRSNVCINPLRNRLWFSASFTLSNHWIFKTVSFPF